MFAGRLTSLSRLAGLGVVAAFALSCSSPVKPTPPPAAPAISCPASQMLMSMDNQPVRVNYPEPNVTGGALPVVTACTPGTGTSFPLGTATVTCSSTDAQQRTAGCAFTVTVQPALRLAVSAVLAFGDSITEGKPGPAFGLNSLTGVGCPHGLPTAYPAVLSGLLKSQYPTQDVTTLNCGWGGETATEGVVRLPTGLVLGAFDVVIVMEGANDLNEVHLGGGTQSNAVDRVATAVVSMIRTARAGRTVFVGTLTPQRKGGKAPRPEWVEPVNARLRAVVPSEGGVLVDIYQALGSSPDPYIDADGLHPTVAGYQKIAEAFFTAMRLRLETRL
jgi:lysophospholipase L1-like esterase